jgi:hypothetical protein
MYADSGNSSKDAPDDGRCNAEGISLPSETTPAVLSSDELEKCKTKDWNLTQVRPNTAGEKWQETSYFAKVCSQHDGSGEKGRRAVQWRQAADPDQPERSFVFGGEEAKLGQYPYVALILDPNDNYFKCTGSILDDRHVVTAAHCLGLNLKNLKKKIPIDRLFTKSDFVLCPQIGQVSVAFVSAETTSDTQTVGSEMVYIHSLFKSDLELSGGGTYDIAVIRLQHSITFSDVVKPVCVRTPSDLMPEACEIAGFGLSTLEEDDKNWRVLPIQLRHAGGMGWMDQPQCESEEVVRKFAEALTKHQVKANKDTSRTVDINLKEEKYRTTGKICYVVQADGKSNCHGDSGGPVFCRPPGTSYLKLYGIIMAHLAGNCGSQGTWNFAESLQLQLTWLEYVAYPMVKDAQKSMERAGVLFQYCMAHLDWGRAASESTSIFMNHTFTEREKMSLCRWFTAYDKCMASHPTPAECKWLDDFVTPDIYDDYELLRCRHAGQG